MCKTLGYATRTCPTERVPPIAPVSSYVKKRDKVVHATSADRPSHVVPDGAGFVADTGGTRAAPEKCAHACKGDLPSEASTSGTRGPHPNKMRYENVLVLYNPFSALQTINDIEAHTDDTGHKSSNLRPRL
ncbi:hypothetical protein Salat_2135700 [Sesamum alatum]|uniref:Uncharacterized protein n=1 Tax=Sesamum alatum TaxID=300844 RepID=A0AAE2CGY1_9LAMI|nr:hypothetical protein Salat_2135700 [Sesamum alatum]